ncbi:MAG: hypothetical protein NC393_06980 [Clostridium sp.]|nr:hypothetical protein [Clostridium sp.]MCM1208249.1 hypothetical protein [Ruminococcus sp.]
MGFIYKSIQNSWIDISMDMYNYDSRKALDDLYKIDGELSTLKTKLAALGKTVNLNCNVTFDMLEDLNEKRRKLISFADGIHYELSYLADNPFSVAMGNIVEAAYALNPKDIKVSTAGPSGTEVTYSLESLISADIYDATLKADFEARVAALDTDEISYDLSQALIEGDYWEGEYEKALKIAEAQNEIFTADVRNNWVDMSDSDRKKLAKKYIKKLIEIYGGKVNIYYKVKFDDLGDGKFGNTVDGTIWLNYDFIDSPVEKYSVDKFIDTMTHEARHMYQQDVENEPDKYNVPLSVIDGWGQTVPYSKDYFRIYYHTLSETDARALAALARMYY